MEISILRKVFRTGNSVVVSLPKDALEILGIRVGVDVFVNLDRENRQIVIALVEEPLAMVGVDKAFAKQVADFIEQYRPALEARSGS
jgi:antitoxin component of MazEF toxin-antitoxin module